MIESLPLSAPGAGSILPAGGITTSEADAWPRIRAALPGGPAAQPTWLPGSVDRSVVELRTLRVSPAREYEVVYRDNTGARIATFRLGEVERLNTSAVEFCCVRGARATALGPGDQSRDGVRQVRWEEQRRTLSITSDRLSSENLLRIAWSLDRTTMPPLQSEMRQRTGACASSATPEDTVARLLSLTGSRDLEAVFDCFASDALIAIGSELRTWAELPAVTGISVRRSSEFGGRSWVEATWTFVSAPGVTWSSTNTRFFLVGQDGGPFRIYEVTGAVVLGP